MARRFTLSTIAPPASPLTPEVAGRWMRTTFPALASLGAMASHRDRLSRSATRASAIWGGLLGVRSDVATLAEACALALETRAPVDVVRAPRFPVHRRLVRELRAALEYAERQPWHRGARMRARALRAVREAVRFRDLEARGSA